MPKMVSGAKPLLLIVTVFAVLVSPIVAENALVVGVSAIAAVSRLKSPLIRIAKPSDPAPALALVPRAAVLTWLSGRSDDSLVPTA